MAMGHGVDTMLVYRFSRWQLQLKVFCLCLVLLLLEAPCSSSFSFKIYDMAPQKNQEGQRKPKLQEAHQKYQIAK